MCEWRRFWGQSTTRTALRSPCLTRRSSGVAALCQGRAGRVGSEYDANQAPVLPDEPPVIDIVEALLDPDPIVDVDDRE